MKLKVNNKVGNKKYVGQDLNLQGLLSRQLLKKKKLKKEWQKEGRRTSNPKVLRLQMKIRTIKDL